MQATERKIQRLEETFILSSGTEEDAINTLKRATLYRVATRLTGCTRKAQMYEAESLLRDSGRSLVAGEDYLVQYNNISAQWEMHKGQLFVRPLYGIVESSGVLTELKSLDDVLHVLAPDQKTMHLSLSMAQRFMRYDVAESEFIEQPTPAPGVGYLHTFTKHPDEVRQILEAARNKFRTTEEKEVLIRDRPPKLYFKSLVDDADPVYNHFVDSLQK